MDAANEYGSEHDPEDRGKPAPNKGYGGADEGGEAGDGGVVVAEED